jgi:hypothetical protein
MLTSLTSGPRCNEWEPWELLGRICVGTFWGRIYWALNIHEETASLSLETYGEESRGATVAKALEVAMSPSLKFCCRIRGLWLQVAGRDVDALGAGERTNGLLRLDGALPIMSDFSSAEAPITAATAASSTQQDAISTIADRARRTLEWTDRLHPQEHRDCPKFGAKILQ